MGKTNNHQGVYLAFTTFFIVAAFVVLKSFMFGLLWGAVMAVSLWPLYEKSLSRCNAPTAVKTWRALAFTLAFALVFLGPMGYGVYEIVNVYSAGSSYVTNNSVHGVLSAPEFLKYLPFSDKLVHFWADNVAHSTGLVDLLNRLSDGKLLTLVSAFGGQLMDKVTTVLVMLISLYFMLKNGAAVKARYAAVLGHWSGARSVGYVQSAIGALRGTINGVVLVGAVEGLLLAGPLVMGGVTSGLLIGLCAGLLGVIPLLMPLLILPCLGYLFLAGQTTWAVCGAIDLALVWFIFENVVKPQVIGQKVRINTFLILAAMVGGLQVLGLVGLFLGPALVSVALGMLKDLTDVSGEDEPVSAVTSSAPSVPPAPVVPRNICTGANAIF